jgi:hypothetical protein
MNSVRDPIVLLGTVFVRIMNSVRDPLLVLMGMNSVTVARNSVM